MRIVILRSAVEDLARGRDFYDQQGEGLGDYFEASLTADIDSLRRRPASARRSLQPGFGGEIDLLTAYSDHYLILPHYSSMSCGG